jgi:uncharacterized membrane protein
MRRKIKNIFLTGLVVVVPIGVTIYILIFLIQIMDGVLAVIPKRFHPEAILGFHVPGLGVIFTFILIMVVGLMTRSWLGGKIVGVGEKLLNRIPVVRSIYQATKQLVDAIFTPHGRGKFRKVVFIEFPREGLYTVAFVTSMAKVGLQDEAGAELVNVFVPTAPNPTSGYFLMVPESELIPADMTVEEAFKLVVSGGLIGPGDKIKHK